VEKPWPDDYHVRAENYHISTYNLTEIQNIHNVQWWYKNHVYSWRQLIWHPQSMVTIKLWNFTHRCATSWINGVLSLFPHNQQVHKCSAVFKPLCKRQSKTSYCYILSGVLQRFNGNEMPDVFCRSLRNMWFCWQYQLY